MAPRVQRVSVAGAWWQTPHGADPLWLASPPSSGRWQRGETLAAIYLADEEETAWAEWYRVLAEIALRSDLSRRTGWTVVHDIQQRFGNYDHVAVGPNGVFLLDSKNLEGVVEIKNGMARLSRRHDPEARCAFEQIRPRALGAAAGIKEDIERRTGRCLGVQAVVVFWSEFPEQLVEDSKCVYIHGSRLKPWLAARPELLDRAQVHEIAAAIQHLARESEGSSARLAN